MRLEHGAGPGAEALDNDLGGRNVRELKKLPRSTFAAGPAALCFYLLLTAM